MKLLPLWPIHYYTIYENSIKYNVSGLHIREWNVSITKAKRVHNGIKSILKSHICRKNSNGASDTLRLQCGPNSNGFFCLIYIFGLSPFFGLRFNFRLAENRFTSSRHCVIWLLHVLFRIGINSDLTWGIKRKF